MFQHFAPAAADQGKKCAIFSAPSPCDTLCVVQLLLMLCLRLPMPLCITSPCDSVVRWRRGGLSRTASPWLCLARAPASRAARRSQRGRHSTKYTEEMEDKELLADEEGGKDVRAPWSLPLCAGGGIEKEYARGSCG